MQLRQEVNLRQVQTLSPQFLLSQRLLQMTSLELRAEISNELSENPALELEETEEEPVGQLEEPAGDDSAERAFEEQISDLEEEWNESLGSSYRPRGDGEDPKYEAMQNTAAPGPSLRDYLAEQLSMTETPARLKDLAELIIYNLDDAGYLPMPLEDVFKAAEQTVPGSRLPVAGEGSEAQAPAQSAQPATAVPELPIDPPPTPEEAARALELVQSLDPPGVGARSTQECILIQLRRSPGDTAFEESVIAEHFQDLAQNRLPKIAEALGATMERVKEAVEVIATMNPRPGALFGGASSHYVRPDIVVEAEGDGYEVRLNDWGLPRLRVSPAYIEMLREKKSEKGAREYLQEKVRAAKWLIEAVNQRKSTLLKIAGEVVKLQRGFLDNGVADLKPLPMQEVADRLNLHVSTVSRAMTDKYVQTPQGVFPLRYFIVGGYQTADGEGESARAVMERIKEMVGKESTEKPLTDQQIVSALRAAGLDVARRTVAKYREKCGIAGSRQRKKY